MLEKMMDMAIEIMANGKMELEYGALGIEHCVYSYQGAKWRLTFRNDYITGIEHI